MGMQESSRAPGWYNGYNENIYTQNEYNVEKTKQAIKADFKNQINFFLNNPLAAFNHYRLKTISQRTEPTYESIWLSQLRYYHNQSSRPSNFVGNLVYYGASHQFLSFLMNFYSSFLYITSFISICSLYRKKKFTNCSLLLFPLIFLGGFFYHLLFEAKSQYLITYALILIPYSAYGFKSLVSYISSKIEKKSVTNQ